MFKLPEKVEGEGFWATAYNKTLGSSTYKEKVKPIVDKALGGTLRLFADKVSTGTYYSSDRQETVLYMSGYMPTGTTLEQMNAVVMEMESYLSEFPEIRQFQTSVYKNSASIRVFFTKEALKTSFPLSLDEEDKSKANALGGAQWSVSGVGDYFSNRTYESAGNNSITVRVTTTTNSGASPGDERTPAHQPAYPRGVDQFPVFVPETGLYRIHFLLRTVSR